MPKIPTYTQRFQPLDGTKAVVADPGVKNYYIDNDLISGWLGINANWTYASASTINVPSGAASIYQAGDKVRFKQGGAYKSFYIISVADTLLTVYGGSDHTVANAAITDIYISRYENPFGFPDWLNYTPTLSAGAGTVSAVVVVDGLFKISARQVYFLHRLTYTLSGAATATLVVSAPVAINLSANQPFVSINDESPFLGRGNLNVGATTLDHSKSNFSSFTNGAGKYVAGNGFYPL